MDLRDTPEEAEFRAELRHWLARIGASAARWSERDAGREWMRALHGAGYAGLTWPVRYGGQGHPPAFQAIFLEETARHGVSDHAGVVGLGMVGPTLIAWGTDTQREWYLPRILAGETVFCQGFSEPEAGSDLAAVRTVATPRDGGGFTVTGRKLWSSYGHLADYCFLLARDSAAPAGDIRPGRHDGLTCLVIDLRAPGVEVRPIRQLTGEEGFAEIALDEVPVPASAMVGAAGDGWRVAMTTLAHERGTFGFTLTARLERQFQQLLDTVRATGADRDAVVRDRVAQLAVDLAGLRATNARLASELARGGQPGPETSIVKLRWSAAQQRLTALALELVEERGDGGLGYDWPRHQVRSRATTIEGGTSEILRDIVATRVLSLPRSR